MPAPETAPRLVGRYAVAKKIAEGGMASVHFGRLLGPAGFSRTVAIKCMHAHLSGDRQFLKMLMDEANLAGRIRHPNVVPMLDVVTTGDQLLLVMEYVHGESLARLIKLAGAPVPPRIAVAILTGALHGLHAAHEARTEQGAPLEIVHRDVSPQNLLVGADGLTRVVDFGIAKAAVRLHQTAAGEMKGKLAYMSPEQLAGTSVDRRGDVYAAGVVLWEALTGKRLFGGLDAVETVTRVKANVVPAPSSVVPTLPRALDEVVLRAVAGDREQRFSTAREMAGQLERALPSAPVIEVSEWVESIAWESLAARSRDLEEVERIKPAADPNLAATRAAPDLAKTTVDPNAGRLREDLEKTTSPPNASPDTTVRRATFEGDTRPGPLLPLPAAPAPPAKKRGLAWALAGGALLLVGGALASVVAWFVWQEQVRNAEATPAPPSPVLAASVAPTPSAPSVAEAPPASATPEPAPAPSDVAPARAATAIAPKTTPAKPKPAAEKGGSKPPPAPKDAFGELSR